MPRGKLLQGAQQTGLGDQPFGFSGIQLVQNLPAPVMGADGDDDSAGL